MILLIVLTFALRVEEKSWVLTLSAEGTYRSCTTLQEMSADNALQLFQNIIHCQQATTPLNEGATADIRGRESCGFC